MSETTVVNSRFEKYDIYIGRDSRSTLHYGNPFTHKHSEMLNVITVKDRDTAVFYFQRWLEGFAFTEHEPIRRLWILANLEFLRGKRLGCFCKPMPCHGDVYVRMLGGKHDLL
jgi:hypothetical protein